MDLTIFYFEEFKNRICEDLDIWITVVGTTPLSLFLFTLFGDITNILVLCLLYVVYLFVLW